MRNVPSYSNRWPSISFALAVCILLELLVLGGCTTGPGGPGGGDQQNTGFTVTVSASPETGGTIHIQPEKTTYQTGDKVVLTAIANDEFQFDHWEGDASGSSDSVEVTVDKDLSITAIFAASPGTTGLKIAEETVVLASTVQVTAGQNGQMTLSGDGIPSTIAPGSVVVSSRGTGRLFRVLSVTSGPNGTVVLETQPAAITDVIQTGDVIIKNKFELDKAVVTSGGDQPALVTKRRAAKVGFSNGKLELSGTKLAMEQIGEVALDEFTLGFNPDVDFALRIRNGSLQEFRCIIGGDVDMHLLASITSAKISDALKEEATVVSLESSPMVVMVGYVPVVYQFVFDTKLGAEMKVGNLGTVKGGFDLKTGLSAGIEYLDKQWNPYFDYRFEPTPFVEQWSITPITVEVYVKPSVGVKFYGIVGPNLAVKPYLKGIGDYRYEQIGAELRAGLASEVGVDLDVLEAVKLSFTQELFDVNKVLAARLAFADPPGDMGTFDMNPKPGPLGFYLFNQPVTLTAMANQDYELAGWSIRHLCDSDSTVKRTNPLLNEPIDASKYISAGFVPKGYGDSWSGEGTGTGDAVYTLTTEVFPPEAGMINVFPQEDKYKWGINVLATARANPNFEFHHWEGALVGPELTQSVKMDANKTIRAVFASTVPRELKVPEQYGTIQAALDAATYNDKILLAAGTYSGTGNRDLDFHGRNVSLIGAGMDQTTIDLSGTGTGDNTLTSLTDMANFKFSDLTVKKGSWPKIGVLQITGLRNFSLENCQFQECTARAISEQDCENFILKNCKFVLNTYGSPIVDVSNTQVTDCIFDANNGCPLQAENSTITGCTFTQNQGADKPGAIDATNCRINTCTFSENQGTCGAVETKDSEVSDCQFTANVGAGTAGAITTRGGQIRRCVFETNGSQGSGGGAINAPNVDNIDNTTGIQDCDFTANTAKAEGGAIEGQKFAILNCTFTRNKADKAGGAVYCSAAGSIGNCTFTANEAGTTGGAIDGNGMTIHHCQIRNNKSHSGCGGAKLVHSTMNFCTIDANTADTGEAGGLGIVGYLFNTTITNNSVLGEGNIAGGLHASGQSIVFLCTVTNNSLVGKIQSWGGGGGYIENSYVGLCKFENNTVTDGPGGGLVARGTTLANCQITGNSCLDGQYKSAIVQNGGGIYMYGSEILGSTVSGNRSVEGGGIYIEGQENSDGTTRGLIQDCTVTGNQAKNSGGVYAKQAMIQRTTVSVNTADYVGGISAIGANIAECRVLNNTSPKGGGLNATGLNDIVPTIVDTEIAGNTNSNGLVCGGVNVANCNIHDNSPENCSGSCCGP